MLDAIERVSQTAITTLQTSANKGFTLDCLEEFKTLEVRFRFREGYFRMTFGSDLIWKMMSKP